MMALCVPAPKSVQRWADRITHPGLLLDKYVESYDDQRERLNWSDEVQRPALNRVACKSQAAPEGLDYPNLLKQWRDTLHGLSVRWFECKTTSPLTLHLARASALENAGICLHPLYGFTYLPGSGLKGMAHAYATQVWHPAQTGDPQSAWEQIRQVFGWSPSRLLQDIADDLGVSGITGSSAGSVVFHDAWPVTWPRLIVDIVNNHHRDYYQSSDVDQAPGDWEDPVPVYFLAVPAGQCFSFALSRRGQAQHNPDEIDPLELAQNWLLGALCHLGAGAKTNAGYGSFCPTNMERPPLTSRRHAESTATVELVTPAFLAGADQSAEDCDLRPATLRGLFRWWWRTLHAGFLDIATLRSMETAIWGDAKNGGAVRIVVESLKPPVVEQYNYKDGSGPQPWFKRDHALADPLNRKTSQGLFYVSYGMDEGVRRRFYVEPGAQWSVRLIARASCFRGVTLDVQDVLLQAEAALWLWRHCGSCGSKARKGFGSFRSCGDTLEIDSLDKCRIVATKLRQRLSLGNQFNESLAKSAAFGPGNSTWAQHIEVPIASADPWQVMDHVGFAYQAVAQHYSHQQVKVALGLPRKIHEPRNEPLRNQDRANWQRPKPLHSSRPSRSQRPGNERYASPVWIHVDAAGEQHTVHAWAFPAAYLPSIPESREFLQEFLQQLCSELQKPLARPSGGASQRHRRPSAPHKPEQSPGTRTVSEASPKTVLPPVGTIVEAVLLDERTKKGGWKARHAGTGITGPIQNSPDVPPDKKPGDQLELSVQYAKEHEIGFRYLTEQDRARLATKKPKTKGGRRDPRRR